MRIFMTGATGYIGSAVLDALTRAGHELTAVVRGGARRQALNGHGVRTVAGDLADPASYRDAARGHDGFVHTAFEASARGPKIDRLTIETLLEAAGDGDVSKPRFLIYTSGVWVLGNTPGPATEAAPLDPIPLVAWRPAHEAIVLDAHSDRLRTAVVRPGIVYGGSRGIVSDILKDAQNGLIRVIGPGENHWPLIYDRDLADVYVRLAGHPEASGVFHANDEGDERVNGIVAAIVSQMPARADVRHVPIEEARAKLGPYADALALDQVVRSPRARELGWAPALHSVAGNTARLLDEWRRGQTQS
jgi:nucleoside-diphosphate-sugar epimerase